MNSLKNTVHVFIGSEVWSIPYGFETDGCTIIDIPIIDKLIKKIFNFNELERYCWFHDFVCRYGILEPEQAHLRLRIGAEKATGPLRAWIIWKLASADERCENNIPLPKKWENMRFPTNSEGL